MSNLKEQFKEDKTSFFHYYKFLSLLPRPESLLLAYLIDQDAFITDREGSYFRCPRNDAAAIFCCKNDTIDSWLDKLIAWGYIKKEVIKKPRKANCTYVSLQEETILKLREVYEWIVECPEILNDVCPETGYMYTRKSGTVGPEIGHMYTRLSDRYKNIKESDKNSKGIPPEVSHSEGEALNNKDNCVHVAPVKNLTKSDADILEYGKYKHIRVTRAWTKAALAKYGDEATTMSHFRKLDQYLEDHPDQIDWALNRGLSKFLEYIERAIKQYGKEADWNYPKSGFRAGL